MITPQGVRLARLCALLLVLFTSAAVARDAFAQDQTDSDATPPPSR